MEDYANPLGVLLEPLRKFVVFWIIVVLFRRSLRSLMGESDRSASSGSASGVSAELRALLDAQREAILSSVNDRISGLQSNLRQQQDELASQFASAQEVESPVFKKKGNEQQFKFNQKVLKANNKAAKALECGNLAKVKECLTEGTVLLANRQKLIKLADKSEYGWATIQEYVDDELADNEADAKKIKKAEKRAAERVKSIQEKKKKSLKSSQANVAPNRAQLPVSSQSSPPFGPYFRPQSSSRSAFSFPARSLHDMCFRCGRRGHWADTCPKYQKSSSSGSK